MTEPHDASVASQGVMRGSFSCAWCSEPVVPYRKPREGELVFCRSGRCRRLFWDHARRVGQQQLALRLESRGMARATDPVSSHEAAVEAQEAGTRERDEQRALKLVTWHPGLSAYELATVAVSTVPHWWGTQHAIVYHAIARRLSKLRELGKVSNRRDLDARRQVEEPDQHKVEGCRGRPVEWWPVVAKQEAA